ncbi:MAG TPA: tetratricopeptide repeat protein [Solirubrobacteraceae bacterium]|nr:tetratricopeptide repeat protein [Solirubrobacteraceae bacterium]
MSATAVRTNSTPVATRDTPPVVSVTLLGGFAASVDGRSVPDTVWRLRKARELVKLLALAPGHRLHREQAMDVLWRDRAPAAAANNLHQAIYVARRALGAGAIELREELLRLNAEVDVERFERATADARDACTHAGYEAALSVYRGELLPENRYDDWVIDRREELADLAEALAEELAALGPAVTRRPPPLPVATSSFVGRERELGELRTLLRGTRLLTLVGTGGVGKTRLALELARVAQASHPDGIAMVELAPVSDPALVADALADALDVRALPGQTPLDALLDHLARSSILLVIDNCEHLLGAITRLAEDLRRSAPGLTILATSREPLHAPGEVVFRVPSLGIPDPDRVPPANELIEYEAVRLFVERSQAAAPGFLLDDENAADVARICARLDGLPLALELAAGRHGALGAAAIADRLDDRFRVLRNDSGAAPTRQQTLSATLDWSHDLLAEDERVLLRRLGVFAGGFALDAAETVCAWGELDPVGIADVLARLIEKSLVLAGAATSRERRFRLLETVRIYASHRLEEAGETAALIERHARWALALAEAERGSSRLDRDAANLRAGLKTLVEREPTDGLRFCVALWPFWMRRIDLHEAQRRLEQSLAATSERTALRCEALLAAAAVALRSGELARALAHASDSYDVAAEVGDGRGEWKALQFLGECAIARDAADTAVDWLERALEVARRHGFAAEEAIGVYSIGVAHWVRGDAATAEELVRRSIDLLRPLAWSSHKVMSPVNVSEVRTRRPVSVPGLRIEFQDTLQPFVEVSCGEAIGYVLANQAGIARARGDLGRARALLDESAARFEAADDDRGIAAVLVRRAYLDLADEDLDAARLSLRRALELRQADGDRRGLGLALVGLGVIETAAGDHGKAECHLSEARAIFRKAGDRWGFASSLWASADLAFARGDLDVAEASLLNARAVLELTRRERWIANTVTALAQIATLQGQSEKAAALFDDARHRYALADDTVGVFEAQLAAA